MCAIHSKPDDSENKPIKLLAYMIRRRSNVDANCRSALSQDTKDQDRGLILLAPLAERGELGGEGLRARPRP